MFPRLRQHLLAGADRFVELSTLGEYGLDEHGAVMVLDPPVHAEGPRSVAAPRPRGTRCDSRGPNDCCDDGRGSNDFPRVSRRSRGAATRP